MSTALFWSLIFSWQNINNHPTTGAFDTSCLIVMDCNAQRFQFPTVAEVYPQAARAPFSPAQSWMFQQDDVSATYREQEEQEFRCLGCLMFLICLCDMLDFLQPIKICLIGPPAVGKSTVAKKLCSHYQIHHITIADIIEEKFVQLVGGYKERLGMHR